MSSTVEARRVRVSGTVQGVGFRPYVYRLALTNNLCGWVLNGDDGVEIHVEGDKSALDSFTREIEASPPPAARISRVSQDRVTAEGHLEFTIRKSEGTGRPTVRISPDLCLCDACRRELFDPSDRRLRYPYINCTDCGPRYTIIERLPYDRPQTTMKSWPLCDTCRRQYEDPLDRRFHAQPVACPECGPHYALYDADGGAVVSGDEAVEMAAKRLAAGAIVAVKGLGGYHLAADAGNATSVVALRKRKFRKEKPFALMVRDLATARKLAVLSDEDEELLASTARPIVLAPAREVLLAVAPGINDLGLMLPYTPVHELLFAAGAPPALVMTSANRSNEPIAFRDAEALKRLAEIADAFLIGERPIARRVDDSVVRTSSSGPVMLRRARGYAPAPVCSFPTSEPILALGADLKSAVTLVVDGEAVVSQHLGDLEHLEALDGFRRTIDDLVTMYGLEIGELRLVHDTHPQYVSTLHARTLKAASTTPVQHHRAHVASVLAEREAWDARVVAAVLDGTGYGDDGSIWGGEIFVGGLEAGFVRAGHLRQALLPGGDAAARFPVQAAAGFLAAVRDLPDLLAPPFAFPDRYTEALQLVAKQIRCHPTTSAGRLFDTVAALLGFCRPMTYEGQAAIWLEHLASGGEESIDIDLPCEEGVLDWRPALAEIVAARKRGENPAAIAYSFHSSLAAGLSRLLLDAMRDEAVDAIALTGGVFQNRLLLNLVRERLDNAGFEVWTNSRVPPNDGGISLGQAAMVAAALNLPPVATA